MSRIAPVAAGSAGPLVRLAHRYARARFGQVPEPFQVMAHSGPVMWTNAALESAVERGWTSLDAELRELAQLRAALTVACPWCVDFGSMLGVRAGTSRAKLEAVPEWRTSGLFSALERLVLDYAEALSETPLRVTDELVADLRAHLSERQLVELTSLVALENSRARFNAGLDIGQQGFSAGSCAVRVPGTAGSAPTTGAT